MIPIPAKYESESKFMNRCTRALMIEGTNFDESQQICYRTWKNSDHKEVILTPTEMIFLGAWIKGTFAGKYTLANLPAELFEFNYLNIMSGVGYGFGLPSDFMPKTARFDSVLRYRTNISMFSGAKTFQMQSILSQSVFNLDGTKRTFVEFNKIGKTINNQYNKNYLRVEQNGAFRIAQSAEEWHEIEEFKDVLPYIEYVTVGDGLVRPSHAAWNGIILPVNHSFWTTRMPPNDWGCRCRVIQKRSGKTTNLTTHLKEYNANAPKSKKVKTLKNQAITFNNNPGKSGLIYGKDHPYFKIPNKHKSSALENFGFTDPTDDKVRLIMQKTI